MSDTEDDEDEGGGGFDLGELLKQAQAMQEQVMAAQATAADQVVEGSAGGGVVKVTVTGGMEFRAVHIDPSAVDPERRRDARGPRPRRDPRRGRPGSAKSVSRPSATSGCRVCPACPAFPAPPTRCTPVPFRS